MARPTSSLQLLVEYAEKYSCYYLHIPTEDIRKFYKSSEQQSKRIEKLENNISEAIELMDEETAKKILQQALKVSPESLTSNQ